MKKGHLLLPIFIAITLLVISCTKHGPEGPPGATGAQGPKGDNGENGSDGTDGATGPQGPAGTANVIYSHWFTNDELSIPWTDSIITETITGDPETVVRAVKFAPDITTQLLDSGVVLSYVRSLSLISPQLLPWMFSYTDESSTMVYCQLNLVPQEGGIVYYIANQTTHNASGLTPSSGFEYRYIIIPGGVLAGGRKMNPASMTYSELCKTYNIPQ